jgi:Domain of unknown function (DUF5069)
MVRTKTGMPATDVVSEIQKVSSLSPIAFVSSNTAGLGFFPRDLIQVRNLKARVRERVSTPQSIVPTLLQNLKPKTKNTSNTSWRETFSCLFTDSVSKYEAGHQKAVGLVNAEGTKFLASIGYSGQEFFDFIEDFCDGGEPTLETALNIAEVRRDYFLNEQKRQPSSHRIDVSKLPAKDTETAGIVWLPRIIPKAEAKLRGEMPNEIMYCCGGDRKFFRTNGIDPVAFLKRVWLAKGDEAQVIDWVVKNRKVAVE